MAIHGNTIDSNTIDSNTIYSKAARLLRAMISTPSFSGEEEKAAELIRGFLEAGGCTTVVKGNNVIAPCSHFDYGKPTLLLNSHMDTVKPSSGYTRDPFMPETENGRLYGLGSNDAGASVAGLVSAFLHFYDRKDLPFNLILAITAEEENSGNNGMRLALPFIEERFGKIAMAIVGEPTGMNAAVAERGLMVLDCETKGTSGHAARDEGDNAIYKAITEIEKLRNFRFARMSERMGAIKINVTMINAGTQHNVIPDRCRFTADVRTTDAYTNQETASILAGALECTVTPRSTRLQASSLPAGHPLELAADMCGMGKYISPTTSDMALMPFPSIKIGIGESSRSHTADEYVKVDELYSGIDKYIGYIGCLAGIYATKQ